MGQFAATEAQGHLDLVALLEEAANRLHLGLVVVVVNARAKFDFLHLDDFLALAGLGGLFLLKKAEFAIIEDLADRGRRIGDDFDQIEPGLFRQSKGLFDVLDALILTFLVDQHDLAGADLTIGFGSRFLRNGRCFHWAANGLSPSVNRSDPCCGTS